MTGLKILLLGIWIVGFGSVRAETISASLDADTYHFTQTYNTARTGTLNSGTFHVGMHNLDTVSAYYRHFNFAGIEFSNLSGLTTAGSKFLQLNLKTLKPLAPLFPVIKALRHTTILQLVAFDLRWWLSVRNFRKAKQPTFPRGIKVTFSEELELQRSILLKRGRCRLMLPPPSMDGFQTQRQTLDLVSLD